MWPLRNRNAEIFHMIFPSPVMLARVPAARRRVALTLDDGPDGMTPAYLDALDRLGIRATFFVIGRQCAQRPDDVLEMIRRGHEVASHGFSHRRLPLLGWRELLHELEDTARLLPPALRRRPLLRPPGGHVSPRTLGLCALAGYTTVLWSINSEDYRVKDPERVARAAIPDDLRPGEIVLLHEGQQWTLEALPLIAERARGLGYEFCTVSELQGGPGTPAA